MVCSYKVTFWGFFKAKYNTVKNKQTSPRPRTHKPFSSTEQERKTSQWILPHGSAKVANGFHIHACGSTWHIWSRQNQSPVVLHTDLDWQLPNSYEVRVRRLWEEIIHLTAAILRDSNYLFHVPVIKWKIASKWAIRVFFLPPLTPIWLSQNTLMKRVSQDTLAYCSHYTNSEKRQKWVQWLPYRNIKAWNQTQIPFCAWTTLSEECQEVVPKVSLALLWHDPLFCAVIKIQ